MASLAHPRQMTVDEFLRAFDGVEGRWELVRGVPVRIVEEIMTAAGPMMMAGPTPRHQQITGNIYVAMRRRLRGTGCQPFADLQLATGTVDTRLPDIGIYCDPRDLAFGDTEFKAFRHPRVVFEVLSPSTRRTDLGEKLAEYQAIDSVHTIVFVDPARESLETYDRVSANEWRNVKHPPGTALRLADPTIEIPAGEIFARD